MLSANRIGEPPFKSLGSKASPTVRAARFFWISSGACIEMQRDWSPAPRRLIRLSLDAGLRRRGVILGPGDRQGVFAKPKPSQADEKNEGQTDRDNSWNVMMTFGLESRSGTASPAALGTARDHAARPDAASRNLSWGHLTVVRV